MDQQQLAEKARPLIDNLETGKALELVKGFLKEDKKYRLLYNEAIRISAFFNQTRKGEARGTLSYETVKLNDNQINESLLDLIGYIESGDLRPEALQTPANPWQAYYQSHKWLVVTAISTLLIAVAVVVWLFKNGASEAEEENAEITSQDCPFTSDEAFNILLLRFYLPGGELSPEGLIAGQLESFCAANNIAAAVEIMKKPEKPDRLLDYAVADTLGKLCRAKLVIWGQAEKSGAMSEIKTRFKYIGTEGNLALSQIKWQGENQLGAEKTLSSLVSQGELFADIEKVILLVKGIIATESDKAQLALDNLENLDLPGDSVGILVKGMVLAENYLKMGDSTKALSAYDTVLNTHPDYWLARNNRGMLAMQAGNYLEAIEDINAALEKQPDNSNMLLAVGRAYEQSNQLYPAKTAYEKVVRLKEDNAADAAKLLDATTLKIERNERIIKEVEQKNAAQRNLADTLAVVDAHLSLGQNERANQLITSTRKDRPKDPNLVALEVESLLRQRKTAEAEKVVDEAVKTGVRENEILRKTQGKAARRFLMKERQ
jgi:tetratricopeptide (TPR) repeat protein